MPSPASASGRQRVLLIGWDAADWKIIQPLIAAGFMPHLAGLVQRGVMGNLATIQPVLSPMLWTSIATGKRAYKHGVLGFTEVDPATGNIRPVSALSRKVKAVWNILHQTGRVCHVVGWWPSFPVEPLRGAMVSNHFHRAVAPLDEPWPIGPGNIHPPALATELRALRVHPHEIEGDMLRAFVPRAPEIDQHKDQRLVTLAKIFSECVNVQAAATHILQTRPDWDFAAVYFDAIDHFSHAFMRYHPPRLEWVPPADFDLYQDVIKAAYVFHDTMLGAQLALAGPDATVIVMSDHGFQSDHLRPHFLPNEPAGPAAEHRPFGIFVAAGPALKPDTVIGAASILDIAPTILHLFGLPVGRDMDGQALVEICASPAPVSYIDSWEAVEGDAARLPADGRLDSASSSELIKQLADLGYIDPPSPDRQSAAEQTIMEERYNLARALAHGGRSAEAAAIFEESWNRWPGESRFGVQLLQLQIDESRLLEARTTFDLLKQRKSAAMEAARIQLKALLEEVARKQDLDAAHLADIAWDKVDPAIMREVRRLRSRSTLNAKAFAFLEGSLLAAEGHPAAALAALQPVAAAQDSQQPSLALKRAEIQLALRNRAAAQAEFSLAGRLDPVNAAPHIGLARVALAEKNHRSAVAEAASALALNRNLPLAHLIAGLAHWRLRELDLAEAHLRGAVALHPSFAIAHRLLARFALLERGDRAAHFEHRALAVKSRRQRLERRAGLIPKPRHIAEDRAAFTNLSAAPAVAAPPPSPLPSASACVIVVTGLPRSGTSMAMQMLAAGGIPVRTDEARPADASNPRGYLEFEPVKRLALDNSWLAGCTGHAVKLVSHFLPFLRPELKYRVVNMRRPVADVIASQRAMLTRLGKSGSGATNEKLAALFQQQLITVQVRLEHLRRAGQAEVLHLDYDRVVSDPAGAARRLAGFLGDRFNAAAAAAAVDPTLRHRGA